MRGSLLFTCEHGGNDIPPEYADAYRGHNERLASHRGWDPGTLHAGQWFAATFGAPLIASTTSRLLVDLNRSLHHPRVFSDLTPSDRQRIIERYYLPHRQQVYAAIASSEKPVLHIAIHSFTPILNGVTRQADIGILYDPARSVEKQFCDAWRREITGYRVRRNYPYRGIADGLPTALRRDFDEAEYIGIELEINQALITEHGFPKSLLNQLASSLKNCLTLD